MVKTACAMRKPDWSEKNPRPTVDYAVEGSVEDRWKVIVGYRCTLRLSDYRSVRATRQPGTGERLGDIAGEDEDALLSCGGDLLIRELG